MLIGELLSATGSTNFFMTDGLGSVMATFSNLANSAVVQGNQVYDPYGTQRYNKGSMGTNKGFTGQYNDSVSGLDYYNSRYYDPLASVFLSADVAQGNILGMNPYDYVGANPETSSDPTGQMVAPPGGGGGGGVGGPVGGGGGYGSGNGNQTNYIGAPPTTPPTVDPNPLTWPKLIPEGTTPEGVGGVVGAVTACVASFWCMLAVAVTGALVLTFTAPTTLASATLAVGLVVNPLGKSPDTSDVNTGVVSIVAHTNPPQTQPGGGGQGNRPPPGVSSPGGFCSFTPDTQVTTDHGKQAIGTLQVGEKVEAYNPKTHKMELQPIQHVWTHTDSDLVDLTITTTEKSQHGKPVTLKSEVVHTTSEHPFFTTESGFVPAGEVKTGMHILRADGSVGVITRERAVHGTKVMYNLEIAQDHTFTVGDGQWVVHNKCRSQDYRDLRNNLANDGRPVQNGQNPHHLIPCSLRDHDLITATNGGFDINAAYNGRPMWNYRYKPDALGALEPYHANSPSYASRVRGMMNSEFQRLQSSGTLTPDTAFDSLISITDQLNAVIAVIGWFGALQGVACPLF